MQLHSCLVYNVACCIGISADLPLNYDFDLKQSKNRELSRKSFDSIELCFPNNTNFNRKKTKRQIDCLHLPKDCM